jgi:putative ABC transport system substrate-binding protein
VKSTPTLLAAAVLLLAGSVAAQAQPLGAIPRVGVLRPGNPPPGDFGQREAFEGGLRDLGWTPGPSILIEYRYAQGKPERLPQLAAELVRLPVDVIVASATAGVRAAQQATRTIPIVMSTLPDPLGEGLIASLARPGGNTTGLILVSDAKDLARTFAAMGQARVGAILVRRDTLVVERNRAEVVGLAAHRRLPAVYSFREFPDSGGFMSYGANVNDIHRRSATFVDKILKGAKPADLPIERPTKFELVINLKTAKALGLTIPQSVLLRADQIIE